ncbi:hypothetical protein A2V71_00765 [Candidatus Berkelbacteria bacterium RBG_13_40_8]|uniref:Uncharacterized protein n=1 Tax=Candidatus Berkelbacteria bacterium RBG_13_40_8 TaxID=1797467 RepID=A0A1F5DQA6_9BACT|nr:MAG: hypothetical protein A2V71_00765 [Candidatus Berkelbacteria bacterium RBG_13_40_8]
MNKKQEDVKISREIAEEILGENEENNLKIYENNIFCGKCNSSYTGQMKTEFYFLNDLGDIVLSGKCKKCGNKVNRYIESGEDLIKFKKAEKFLNMNKFDDLSEKELISILEKGNLNEADFDKLCEVMEKKGLSGSIMEVDPDDPQSKDLIEYIRFHDELPKDYQSKRQIVKAKKILLDRKVKDVEKLKEAIMILAHSGELGSWKILKKYAENPNPKLIS